MRAIRGDAHADFNSDCDIHGYGNTNCNSDSYTYTNLDAVADTDAED